MCLSIADIFCCCSLIIVTHRPVIAAHREHRRLRATITHIHRRPSSQTAPRSRARCPLSARRQHPCRHPCPPALPPTHPPTLTYTTALFVPAVCWPLPPVLHSKTKTPRSTRPQTPPDNPGHAGASAYHVNRPPTQESLARTPSFTRAPPRLTARVLAAMAQHQQNTYVTPRNTSLVGQAQLPGAGRRAIWARDVSAWKPHMRCIARVANLLYQEPHSLTCLTI